jgi:hypothetical protein
MINSMLTSISAADESVHHGIVYRNFIPVKLNGKWASQVAADCQGYIVAPKLTTANPEEPNRLSGRGRIYIITTADVIIFDDPDAFIEVVREVVGSGPYMKLVSFRASGFRNDDGFAYVVQTTDTNPVDGDLELNLGEAGSQPGTAGFFREVYPWWAALENKV